MLSAPSFILLVENAANFFDSHTLFSYLCIVEKLMHLYLKTIYPKAYVYKSKFGSLIYNMDEATSFCLKFNTKFHINKKSVVNQLMHLFCCDENVAENVYYNWFESLPVYVMGKNLTCEDVLVPLVTECNSTVS